MEHSVISSKVSVNQCSQYCWSKGFLFAGLKFVRILKKGLIIICFYYYFFLLVFSQKCADAVHSSVLKEVLCKTLTATQLSVQNHVRGRDPIKTGNVDRNLALLYIDFHVSQEFCSTHILGDLNDSLFNFLYYLMQQNTFTKQILLS